MGEALDEADLVRLVWHPSHFDGDKLKGSAFSSDDLLGRLEKDGSRRYLSVDDRSLISRASIDWRVAWQQRDGKDLEHGREDARFVLYDCSSVTSCSDGVDKLFRVTREQVPAGGDGPESPPNPAHCGIHNAQSEKVDGLGKGARRTHVEMLRVQLIKLKREILSYCQVFSE